MVWRDVRRFVRRVYEGAAESNVPFLASGLTFDALLASIPLVLLLLSLIGHLVNAGAVHARVDPLEYFRQFLPAHPEGQADPFQPVEKLLADVVRTRGRLGLVGLALFVWFSTRLFGSLRSALNEVFDTEETRPWLRGKLEDIVLVLVTGLLFAASAAGSEGVAILAQRNPRFGFLTFFGGQLAGFGFAVALFAVIFRYAPARRVRRDTALFAAVICGLGFELAKPLVSEYLARMVHPDRLVSDATLGAILLFVAWTYYLTLVFLIGGQIAQVYELRRRQAAQRALLRG